MNVDRIKEIQQKTAYPESVSVQQALMKVWNECEQSRERVSVDAVVISPEREQDVEFMERLLPDNYTCEPRKDGIHCYSDIGIDENDTEQWKYTMMAVKQHFGVRLCEVFHQTCYNHVKFTVYVD